MTEQERIARNYMPADEKRIYVVVAATVQVGGFTVFQPLGRQGAQIGHVVSKLRFELDRQFYPITTIVKACRDSAELEHVTQLLWRNGVGLHPVTFYDTNREAYGPDVSVATAMAVLATKSETFLTLDYLPLWGAE